MIYKVIQSAKLIKTVKKWIKLTAVNLHRNKRRNQTYNVKIISEKKLSIQKSEAVNKFNKKIAAIFKNIINKIFQLDWITDSDISSYMINKFQLFSDSLMCMWQHIIKVRERRLYVNYYDTVIMQNKNENLVLLNLTLYVLKLEVNLLSEKKMCKKRLFKYFDYKSLYMWNKSRKLILKVFEKEKIYIIKHILSSLNEFILLSVMHIQSKSKITLLKVCKNLQIQISEFITDILSENA